MQISTILLAIQYADQSIQLSIDLIFLIVALILSILLIASICSDFPRFVGFFGFFRYILLIASILWIGLSFNYLDSFDCFDSFCYYLDSSVYCLDSFDLIQYSIVLIAWLDSAASRYLCLVLAAWLRVARHINKSVLFRRSFRLKQLLLSSKSKEWLHCKVSIDNHYTVDYLDYLDSFKL